MRNFESVAIPSVWRNGSNEWSQFPSMHGTRRRSRNSEEFSANYTEIAQISGHFYPPLSENRSRNSDLFTNPPASHFRVCRDSRGAQSMGFRGKWGFPFPRPAHEMKQKAQFPRHPGIARS